MAQARNALRGIDELEKVLSLTLEEREGIQHFQSQGFPISITPYYLSLCDPKDPKCPVRKQCIPTLSETHLHPSDLRDPLGEDNHTVAPHLVQRYPDRALLLVTDRCSVYCRFCTRSRMVGQSDGAHSASDLSGTFAYLKAHPEIQEVILSGGDPLVMSDDKLGEILEALSTIEHLNHIRIGTRAPVTLPQRITPGLIETLKRFPSVWIMTHFNHSKELTPESTEAISMLVNHGFPVMNQTVLMKDINDDPHTLEILFRGLVKNRVKPYYLLQMDPVNGTQHFRTPLARGIEIMKTLQGRVSGLCLPKFIVDTPHGKGKVHLAHNPILNISVEPSNASSKETHYTLQTFRGEIVKHVDVGDSA